MAKFTPGVGFSAASGSVAGTVFSHGPFGPYMRNRGIPVNPSTTFQNVVRARFGNLSQTWRTLTFSQQTAWIQQAVNITLVDPLGQTYTPTGAQYYVGLNSNRVALGLAIATTPPALQTAAVITALAGTIVSGTGVVTITFAPAIAAGAFYELAVTAPMSPGRNFIKNSQFKILAYLGNADTTPYVATTLYAARFGGIVAGDATKLVAVRLRPYSSSGYAGVKSQARIIIS